MSRGNYLWDGTGEPDPDVQRLEQLLQPLRSRRPAPDLSTADVRATGRDAQAAARLDVDRVRSVVPRLRTTAVSLVLGWRPFALAAALVFVVGAAWMWTRVPREAWSLQWLQGTSWANARVVREARVAVGDWIETRSDRVRLAVGTIGEVQLEPSTRVRLVDGGRASHRLSLVRGVMHAVIWAPPRQFIVDTPSAVAVDLGCRYTLEVSDDGSGVLRVEAGWVGIERGDVKSLVPAGAIAETRAGRGPGTPHYRDASNAFSDALDIVDFSADREARAHALQTVVSEARARDAFSLWHLLARTDLEGRERVLDRLAGFVPMPARATRDGILAGDRRMLDAWWNELGLGSAFFWRNWTVPLDTSRSR